MSEQGINLAIGVLVAAGVVMAAGGLAKAVEWAEVRLRARRRPPEPRPPAPQGLLLRVSPQQLTVILAACSTTAACLRAGSMSCGSERSNSDEADELEAIVAQIVHTLGIGAPDGVTLQ